MSGVKSLFKVVGEGAGLIISVPIAISKTIKEAAEDVYNATSKTGELAGDIVLSGADVIGGTFTGDYEKSKAGINCIGDRVSNTVSGMIDGVSSVAHDLGDVVKAVSSGDDELLAKSAKKLLRAGIVVSCAFTVADVAGIVDINGNETPPSNLEPPIIIEPFDGDVSEFAEITEGPFFDMEVAEAGTLGDEQTGEYFYFEEIGPTEGLVPEVPVDEIPGVENGIASTEATDKLIEVGCVEDTVHIDDPERDPVMRDAFLEEHGLTEAPEGYEVHHVVPLSEGGADHPDNMVLVTIEEHDKITDAHGDYYSWWS